MVNIGMLNLVEAAEIKKSVLDPCIPLL